MRVQAHKLNAGKILCTSLFSEIFLLKPLLEGNVWRSSEFGLTLHREGSLGFGPWHCCCWDKVLDFPFLTHPLRKGEHEAAFGAGWRWSSCAAEVCCAQRGLNPKLRPISSQQPAEACEHLHTELNLEDYTGERFYRQL